MRKRETSQPELSIFLIDGPGHNYTVFQKNDAIIEITITTTNLIRIKYPLTSFNYRLSGANFANFNKIHRAVFEQQLFKKWDSKKVDVFGTQCSCCQQHCGQCIIAWL